MYNFTDLIHLAFLFCPSRSGVSDNRKMHMSSAARSREALAALRLPNSTCTQADADIVDLAAVTER
jgi:hypothetical protein